MKPVRVLIVDDSATIRGIVTNVLRQDPGIEVIGTAADPAATGAILFVLITALGPISGAHFNPAVTLVMAMRRELSLVSTALYIPIQVAGCVLGAWLAHAMFGLPIVQVSTHVREGAAQV